MDVNQNPMVVGNPPDQLLPVRRGRGVERLPCTLRPRLPYYQPARIARDPGTLGRDLLTEHLLEEARAGARPRSTGDKSSPQHLGCRLRRCSRIIRRRHHGLGG